MATNGGETSPFKKEETEVDSRPMLLQNHHLHLQLHNGDGGSSIAERRAAKCGFNASNINAAGFTPVPPLASQCFTIPPGISPSALLDSPPIMLPNAQAQLSPTTGTFQIPSPTNQETLNKSQLGVARITGHDTFVLNPPPSMPYSGGPNDKPFPEEFDYPMDLQDPASHGSVSRGKLTAAAVTGDQFMEVAESFLCLPASNPSNQMLPSQVDQERSTIQNQDKKGAYIPKEMARYSEDGFYWRKYGQKHVKGSEYPRSYYKCTNTNCPVKKKVERSHDGQITEIVYKGSHNHPKPQPFKTKFGETSDVITEDGISCLKAESAAVTEKSDVERTSDSLDSFLGDFSHLPSGSRTTLNTVEAPETSQDVDNQNEVSPESVSPNNGVDDDDENGESEPKRRKKESFPNEAAVPRSTREPRVVVQIESDIDILDDGYRWRKYGQKVVKGNPNPRSYYKCTTPGCPVRKHVERAANDIKSVITTYEGKHNHQVPSNKSGSLVISDVASLSAGVNNANVSSPSTMAQRLDVSKPGKRIQDVPLYAERRPMFNYSELMSNNFPGRFAGSELNFGAAAASSVYPLSFPPFHSIPYGSVLMNGSNIAMKAYTTSSNVVYPMVPDYVPGNRVTVNPAGSSSNNFQFNSNSSTSVQFSRQENCRSYLKPKQEQRDFGGEG